MKNILHLLLLMLSLNGMAQFTLSDSLVACYSLAGNGNEPINNLTGSLQGVTPDFDRNNVLNECLHFAGNINSIVTLPDDPRLKGQAMTVSAWAYPENGVGSYIVFAKNNFNSYHEAYTISIDYNSSIFNAAKVNSNGIYYATSGQISLYTWYHLAIVVDTVSVKLYVNGALVANTPAPGLLEYETGKPVRIGGCAENYFPAPFTGKIDNVRFYNRLLSQPEINQLYQLDPRCEKAVETGLNQNSETISSVKAYPNPSTGMVRFSNISNECHVHLVNSLGQTVLSVPLSPGSSSIDISQLPRGVYYARVNGNGQKTFLKLVKE
jgi:hypothetical protein